jgi:hypothetical protein
MQEQYNSKDTLKLTSVFLIVLYSISSCLLYQLMFPCTLSGCRVTSLAKLLEKTDWPCFVSFLVLFFILDQRSAKTKILHNIMMC